MRLKKSDIKMLKITKRTEYGLIALTHIEHSSKDNLISSNKILICMGDKSMTLFGKTLFPPSNSLVSVSDP